MQSNLSEFEQEPVLRPTLLTVLCILTFIGSGWAILTNIWAYTTAAESAKMVSYASNRMKADSLSRKDSTAFKNHNNNKPPFGQKLMASFGKMFTEAAIRKNAIGTIIAGLFTLLGAVMMWRLSRNGFYLYILGVLIGIIVPFYLYGNNIIAIGISAFSSFFGLVFIALYALNFKTLKK
ncbi:MAG: hypothetical protein ABJA90_09695 [Ginsengibacter sp.]